MNNEFRNYIVENTNNDEKDIFYELLNSSKTIKEISEILRIPKYAVEKEVNKFFKGHKKDKKEIEEKLKNVK